MSGALYETVPCRGYEVDIDVEREDDGVTWRGTIARARKRKTGEVLTTHEFSELVEAETVTAICNAAIERAKARLAAKESPSSDGAGSPPEATAERRGHVRSNGESVLFAAESGVEVARGGSKSWK